MNSARLHREWPKTLQRGNYSHVQRRGREPGVGMESVEPIPEPGRTHDPNPSRRIELETQVVAQRNEVHEMVRVKVSDHHRCQPARVRRRRQIREGALAKVQQERRVTVANQKARRGRPATVRVGRPAPMTINSIGQGYARHGG